MVSFSGEMFYDVILILIDKQDGEIKEEKKKSKRVCFVCCLL